jgi:hypothetical protein
MEICAEHAEEEKKKGVEINLIWEMRKVFPG